MNITASPSSVLRGDRSIALAAGLPRFLASAGTSFVLCASDVPRKLRRSSRRSGELRTFVAITIAALSACHESTPPTIQRPPARVTVAPAVAEDVPLYLDEIGRIAAREVVSIQPQVSGAITAIHFEDGSDVRTGDALFTIDPRPYRAKVAAAEADLVETRAQLELARIESERVVGMVGSGAVSQADVDEKKNALDVSAANVQRDEAELELARLDLEHSEIRSPIDGRAGQRLVDLGNIVTANTGSLVVIQRLDPVYVDFTVPENELSSVQGQMARGTLAVEVRLPDEPLERTGELTFLDNAVRDGSGTVKLRATIQNADRLFWPGRFVEVRLVLDTLDGAVLVPAAAPQVSAGGPFVFVTKPDSTAELRPVTLGQRQGERVVIASGLAPGEKVVVAGQLAILPGAKVEIVGSGDAQAGGTAAKRKDGSAGEGSQ